MAVETGPAIPVVGESAQGKVWRERAARYRALARASYNAAAKESFLTLADDCERYAAKADEHAKAG